MNQIKHIRLDKLRPPAFDARLSSDQEADDDLRDSIKEIGIQLPLIVVDRGGNFEIVAGFRRFKEAGRAGLPAAPCIVISATGAALEKIKIHENIKRLPLSHVDQAFHFAHLIKEYKMTETNIAILVGKSIAYVSQHLSLLHCDEQLVQAVHDGRINFSVARELVHCKDDDERTRLQTIIEEHGATSTIVQGWVRESNRETDNVQHDHSLQEQQSPIIPAPAPLYPCAVCSTPTKYDQIKSVRMCPGCYNIFFLQLEQERLKQRTETSGKMP